MSNIIHSKVFGAFALMEQYMNEFQRNPSRASMAKIIVQRDEIDILLQDYFEIHKDTYIGTGYMHIKEAIKKMPHIKEYNYITLKPGDTNGSDNQTAAEAGEV